MLDVGWICELGPWLFLRTPDLSNLNNSYDFFQLERCIRIFLKVVFVCWVASGSPPFESWICELGPWLFLHTPDLSNVYNSYGRDCAFAFERQCLCGS